MQSLDNQIWRSQLLTTTKLRLYNTCILPIILYGLECWVVSKTDVRRSKRSTSDAFECCWASNGTTCLKWWCSEANKATETHCDNRGTRLTLFGHIACMDHNADAKRILFASPQRDWRRPPGRSHITWLSTIQHDLRCHNLTLPEAVDMAQNHPLWRLLSMSGTTQSYRVACQKRQRWPNKPTTSLVSTVQ